MPIVIELRPEHERYVHEAVSSGHFRSPDEVVNHALAVLLDEEVRRPDRLASKNLFEVLSAPPFAGSDLFDAKSQTSESKPG
jgi:Arc/MetJ-type ribon-helix-helix transcriptional regulator